LRAHFQSEFLLRILKCIQSTFEQNVGLQLEVSIAVIPSKCFYPFKHSYFKRKKGEKVTFLISRGIKTL